MATTIQFIVADEEQLKDIPMNLGLVFRLDVRRKRGCLSIAVSEAQVHRSLLILDTLLRAFEERGTKVIPVSVISRRGAAK